MQYRALTDKEIKVLCQQGCQAREWKDISVQEGFSTENILKVSFSGKIKLGCFRDNVEVEKGVSKPSGLYNSYIHNCAIGNNVFISQVQNLVNYNIEDNVIIENTGSLVVNSESTFGNATNIDVLNESGGRELPLFDMLSAQIAYMVVLYRHDKELIAALKSMINEYSQSKKSSTGRIENGVRIQHSTAIRNVNFGAFASITGATLLEDGTVKSNQEAPVTIGEGVTAREFIVLSGSSISSGALIERCFVGQGVKMGKHFFAENSAIFANCECFLSEACSLFAGPYTVTHHKSTLLIAGMLSFFNAGSGTNQSNHMYKLGPVHQGIMERGSKSGSSCYLLWPCRVGAYTVVVGKHLANFDTTDFPFSYISEEKGKSILFPAINLFTVGTRRDSEKWPARDRRKDPVKLDIINFALYNPYIAGRMVNAIRILGELSDKASKTQEYISYSGINIPRLLLKSVRKYYETALKVYFGDEVISQIETLTGKPTFQDIRKKLQAEGEKGEGKWVDLFGMLAPVEEIDNLTRNIKSGRIKSIADVQAKLLEIHGNYKKYAWNWCVNHIQAETGEPIENISRERLIQIITDWKESSIRLNNMILKDAEKEYDISSRVGFGIDGEDGIRDVDFEAVRGTYETNKFVLGLKHECQEIEKKAQQIISTIQNAEG
jgi:carbonic anhydrase/acetyltransferase-like protein (isoleucine patch superfamily)